MSTKSKRHVHKYYRVKVAGDKVWACAHSECSHYMPYHMEGLVNGKSSVCWKCDNTMIMNPAQTAMEKPECDECLGIIETESISPQLLEIMRQKGLM